MSKIVVSLALVWLFASLHCGPSLPPDAQEPGNASQNQAQIPGDGVQQIASDGEEPYSGPPHIFKPRGYTPHKRAREQAHLDLARLPSLQLNMGKCFAMTPDEESLSIAASKSSGATSKPSSAARYKSKMAPKKRGTAHRRLESSPSGAPPAPSSVQPMPAAEEGSAPPRASEREMVSDEAAPRDDSLQMAESDDSTPGYEDWGASIYLSNDDTMSLSSAQRVIYAIDKFLPLPSQHIRPHELLNYFSFSTAQVDPDRDFSVYGEIERDRREAGIYTLGLAVNGRPVTKSNRRNTALTLVIDRSGSMSDEGRMSYLKQGLSRMLGELKKGDMVHMVLFDHEVCTPVRNFVVGRDNIDSLKKAIDKLAPRGSTDLHRGLAKGYEIADKTYLKNYSNRVVMITDALTNTGVTDQQLISMISKYYDTRKIRLSGVGVGRDFNDALLDRLTEKGKGAYVFLGSEAEVDAVFGSRFISLIETTALDVHFQLHLPPSLRMNVFYGEESSTVKSDVQEIHYFANTSQLFLADLMARGGKLRPQDEIMLTIEYKDPESDENLIDEQAFNLGQIAANNNNVKKAQVIMAWIDMLAQMAARGAPGNYSYMAGGWEDPEGWQRCDEGSKELTRLAKPVARDKEVRRVTELWKKYCTRYEMPRNPVKRQIVEAGESWPSALPTETR